jgi:hypothetical protein
LPYFIEGKTYTNVGNKFPNKMSIKKIWIKFQKKDPSWNDK